MDCVGLGAKADTRVFSAGASHAAAALTSEKKASAISPFFHALSRFASSLLHPFKIKESNRLDRVLPRPRIEMEIWLEKHRTKSSPFPHLCNAAPPLCSPPLHCLFPARSLDLSTPWHAQIRAFEAVRRLVPRTVRPSPPPSAPARLARLPPMPLLLLPPRSPRRPSVP